ncbi:hypothetical protein PISS_b0419 [Pseudoalteromonas issachenkonii]|uniref:Uncharacterized protein n=1 Tax=Pseudoalteromonas issachenkonii TaxID=152297 RepID=A0ABM6N877_9GAMM|nr:hypothetical protein PISS_b0419 [Pseudoalteromonas issachenkonii]
MLEHTQVIQEGLLINSMDSEEIYSDITLNLHLIQAINF